MAGLLTLGPRAAIGRGAAAAVHGLDRAPGGAVEFVVPRGERNGGFPGVVHSTTTFGRGDVVRVGGLRVTSATRQVTRQPRAVQQTLRARLVRPA